MQKRNRHSLSVILGMVIVLGGSLSLYAQTVNQPRVHKAYPVGGPTSVQGVETQSVNSLATATSEPTLTKAVFFTHTNGEDKDHDTGIYVQVRDNSGSIIAHANNRDSSGGDGTKYKEGSDHQFELTLDAPGLPKSKLSDFRVKVWQRTNGHDTWDLDCTVALSFSDGTSLFAYLDNTRLENNGASVEFARQPGPNGIEYHGGPLMLFPVNIYYIWYGNWAARDSTVDILTDFARNLDGSPYYRIITTYFDKDFKHVNAPVRFAGSTNDNYSRGRNLDVDAVKSIVYGAIRGGRLPMDNNGIYFVLTSSDVTQNVPDADGWHTFDTDNTNLKFALITNPGHCNGCTPPNGNPGADAMVDIVAHELVETATDPLANTWYTRAFKPNGQLESRHEVGDKCEFEPKQLIRLGSRNYLVQPLWVNSDGGFCSMSFDWVYLDQANSSGKEDGSSQFPFRTLDASVRDVIPNGTIRIRPGSYSAPGIYNKPMTLIAPNGNVTLR